MARELGTINTNLAASGNNGDTVSQELTGEELVRGGLSQVGKVTLYIAVASGTGVEVYVDGRIDSATNYGSAGSHTIAGGDPPAVRHVEVGGATDLQIRAVNTDGTVSTDVRVDAVAAAV